MIDKFRDWIMLYMGFYKVIHEKKSKDQYGYEHSTYSYSFEHGGLNSNKIG